MPKDTTDPAGMRSDRKPGASLPRAFRPPAGPADATPHLDRARPGDHRREVPPSVRALALVDHGPADDRARLSRLGIAREDGAGLTLIGLAGALDVYTVARFWERIGRDDPAQAPMVIDLGEVRLIDAAGLGALVSLRNAAHRGGGRVGVVCPRPRLRRLFRAAGLGAAFVIGPDLASVVAGLGRLIPPPASEGGDRPSTA